MTGPSPWAVLFYFPNLIGYARIIAVLASYYLADTNWKASFLCYVLAFVGDAVDGAVARYFNQSSKFGAVLDMVTDRCSTAGLLMVLSRLYEGGTPAFLFLLLMFIDLFSHWMHVQSTAGRHHKAADTLAGRNVITRLFYGCYPFFAFCCVGTELFYVALYLLVFVPEASLALGGGGVAISLHAVCYYVFLPACVCKQAVNVAQLCAASLSLASAESEAADGVASKQK
ncbi:unnamed protein product [Ectocarpus sp. CCAP 1310/34]|nr:unnamed protein product [Ectocarpus sp. CCAP 1310/34]